MSIKELKKHMYFWKVEIIVKSILCISASMYLSYQFLISNNIYFLGSSLCLMFYSGWSSHRECAKYTIAEEALKMIMEGVNSLDSSK